MSKITRSAINQKPIDQNQKKKVILDNIFLHLSANFGVKIQKNNSPIRGWGGLSKMSKEMSNKS